MLGTGLSFDLKSVGPQGPCRFDSGPRHTPLRENTTCSKLGDRSSLKQRRPAGIETARLNLVVLMATEIEALIEGDTERAGRLAGARFPRDWPEEEQARDGLPWHLGHLKADARHQSWRIRIMVERESLLVVGSINLKGPPDAHGDVEIGWGVNADRRHRGYAFEATTAVLQWAESQPDVRRFSATIPEDNLASQGLARKLGMVRTSETRRDLPLWVRTAPTKPSR